MKDGGLQCAVGGVVGFEVLVVADFVVRHAGAVHLERAKVRLRVVGGVVRQPEVTPAQHWRHAHNTPLALPVAALTLINVETTFAVNFFN